jgi:hypothetical protein
MPCNIFGIENPILLLIRFITESCTANKWFVFLLVKVIKTYYLFFIHRPDQTEDDWIFLEPKRELQVGLNIFSKYMRQFKPKHVLWPL